MIFGEKTQGRLMKRIGSNFSCVLDHVVQVMKLSPSRLYNSFNVFHLYYIEKKQCVHVNRGYKEGYNVD